MSSIISFDDVVHPSMISDATPCTQEQRNFSAWAYYNIGVSNYSKGFYESAIRDLRTPLFLTGIARCPLSFALMGRKDARNLGMIYFAIAECYIAAEESSMLALEMFHLEHKAFKRCANFDGQSNIMIPVRILKNIGYLQESLRNLNEMLEAFKAAKRQYDKYQLQPMQVAIFGEKFAIGIPSVITAPAA